MSRLTDWNDSFPDGKEKYVHQLFSSIAKRYDLLNRVLSFRRDVYWRRFTADCAMLRPGDAALDVGTGTGDLAFELARRVGDTGHVVGADFVEEMLELARRKQADLKEGKQCEFVYGNALSLPFTENSFDAATIAFALRNVADIPACLREMQRVVKPGGRVICLELSKPVWPGFKQVFHWYFHKLVPVIGRLGQGVEGPYSYLPQSVVHFPDQEKLAEVFRGVGLENVEYHNLTGGIAAVHVGEVG